jgi:hypothetical protein
MRPPTSSAWARGRAEADASGVVGITRCAVNVAPT